jgi:hypothetical protein
VGALPYQNAASSTAFLPLGTTGFVLTAGASAPTWSSIGALTINTATNIAGGTAGQIPYQSSPGITAFAGPGTAGQLLVSAGATAPVYTSTSSIYVNTAVFTDNVRGGATGSLHYQTAANATGMLALGGTVNSLLVAGATAPQYVIQVQATSGTGSASVATGQSLVVTAGGLGVTGNSYFLNDVGVGGNTTLTGTLRVNSTNASTGTNTSNALYTAGGAWIDKTLVVVGATTFRDTVSFLGTATYVYSTNTVITDNIVNVHGPVGSTPDSHVWTLDDGLSIGQIYHYYKGSDKDAFLGWNNATTYLEWWENGTTLNNGYTGTTLGSFKTGNVILASGVNATNTTSGSLQITNGGAGIGGSVFIGGNLTVGGTINATLNGTITSATNIVGGSAGQIHYQTAPGLTGFAGPGTAGQLLVSAGASAPVYTNTTTIYVGNAVQAEAIKAGGNGSLLYQSAANTTNFLSTGTPGQILVSAVGAPAFTNTSSFLVGYAVNDTGGAAGGLRYQTAAHTSAFLNIGSAGNFLTVNSGGTAPQWSSTSTALIGYAQNISAGTTGQLVYQSAASTTGFVGPGSAGQLLVSAGASAPVYTNTSSIYVNSARFADNLTAGAAGSMPYQSAANATAMLAIGTSGFVLTSNGTAPIWQAISGLSAGSATTATNLAGGTAGQVPYQTGPGGTAFYGPGTAGQILQSGGTGAPSYVNTTSVYIGRSIYSDNIWAGTAGQLHYQSAANVTSFLTTATTGNFLQANFAGAPTWSTTASMYVGGAIAAQNIFGGTAGQVPYQTGPGATSFYGPGTAGQLLVSAGAAAPVYTNTASISVGFGANILGGAVGSLPYQTAANATGFVGIGTNGQVLTSNGTVPVWSAVSGLTAGNATNAANVFQTTDPASTTYRILLGNGTNANAQVYNYSALYWNNPTSTIVGASISGNAATANLATTATSALSAGFLYSSAPQLAAATESNAIFITAPSYTTDSPVKLLNFDWYGNIFSMGNIRSGATPTSGFGFYYTPSSGSRTELARFTPAGALSFGATGTAYGTSGQLLQSNGNASPTWVTAGGVGVGSATTASQVLTVIGSTNANHFLTFVDSNNATAAGETVYTASSLSINPSTGLVSFSGGATGGISLSQPTPINFANGQYIKDNGAGGFVQYSGAAFQLVATSGITMGTTAYAQQGTNVLSVNGGTYVAGNLTSAATMVTTGTTPFSFQGNSQSGTYNQSVIYTNNNNTSGNSSNGIVIERGRLTDSSTAEIRYFTVATRGGQVQFTIDGPGNVTATGEITAYYSDRRLKENVKLIDNALDKVLSLNGITYTPNDLAESFGFNKNKKIVGLFADEVEAVLPEATKPAPFDLDENGGSKSGENYKTVQYEKVVPLLVEAIKDQQKQIAQLTEMVKLLTNK